MNYSNHTAIELALEDHFIHWVNSPDEHSHFFWISFINEYPHMKTVVEEARTLVLLMDFEDINISDDRIENLKKNIFKGIKANELSKSSVELEHYNQPTKSTNWLSENWYKVAAVFFGLALAASIIYFLSINILNTKRYATKFGETQTVTLPDGSVATLNSNSNLRYSNNWDSKSSREVWINGEAFFSVRHKANNQKFVVHVGQLNVEVLGTQFNVNNRLGKIKVVLNSGKVKLTKSLRKEDESLTMLPGELVEFSEKDKNFNKLKVNPETYSSWKSRKWIIEDEPLSDIVQRIEAEYGYKVILKDISYASLRISGTFPINNIDILIKSLSKTLEIDVIKKDNTIIFQNSKEIN